MREGTGCGRLDITALLVRVVEIGACGELFEGVAASPCFFRTPIILSYFII